MITELKIKNFKSHKDTDLKLSNLTVLTGINGSGKTSFIQSLLLLRQSFMKGRLKDGLDLNSPLCDIGIGNDALYRFASEGIIHFGLSDETGREFSFVFDLNETSLNDSFLKKKEYSNHVNEEELSELSLFTNQFQYVSASRWGGVSSFPKETYAAETQKQLSLNKGQGELVAHFLYKFGSSVVLDYSQGKLTDLSLMSQTMFWEQKISPQVTLHVESGKDSNSYSISYGYEGNDSQRPIQNLKAENVGYGVSYTLPVVVALLSAEPGALIIIENPEAHLHPEGQAELAKLIAMVARNGVQVIVETHSDHIITGLQLACKKKKETGKAVIDAEKVAVYYFYNDDMHALRIKSVSIESNGMLKYQPKGFFDRAEQDISELYEQ